MALSEFAKHATAVVVADLSLVAVAFWYFDSEAARFAVFATMTGFTVASVFRLVALWRRERSQDPSP